LGAPVSCKRLLGGNCLGDGERSPQHPDPVQDVKDPLVETFDGRVALDALTSPAEPAKGRRSKEEEGTHSKDCSRKHWARVESSEQECHADGTRHEREGLQEHAAQENEAIDRGSARAI